MGDSRIGAEYSSTVSLATSEASSSICESTGDVELGDTVSACLRAVCLWDVGGVDMV